MTIEAPALTSRLLAMKGGSKMSWHLIAHGSNGDGSDLDGSARTRPIYRDRVEHGLERGEGVTTIACLLAARRKSRKRQPKAPALQCPGHNGHGDISRVAEALGAEVVNLGSPVLRRKRVA